MLLVENKYFYHALNWGDDISVCSFVFNLSNRSQFVSCFLDQQSQIPEKCNRELFLELIQTQTRRLLILFTT